MAVKFAVSNTKVSDATLKASTDCCALTAEAVGEDGAVAMLAQAKAITPNIIATMNTLAGKKGVVASNVAYATTAELSLTDLATKVSALTKCLVERAPASKKEEAAGYVSQIDGAFKSAIDTFKAKSVTNLFKSPFSR